MFSPTRPPNDRTLSSRTHIGRVESPPLSASPISTPSIADDNEPIQKEGISKEGGTGTETDEHEDDERRGRSSTINNSYRFDPRDMSPRRNSEELAQLGAETKAKLEAQAQSLQTGLLALLDRLEKVREEHDKLEGENRFLQEYIGSLMATSKITGSPSGTRSRTTGGRLK